MNEQFKKAVEAEAEKEAQIIFENRHLAARKLFTDAFIAGANFTKEYIDKQPGKVLSIFIKEIKDEFKDQNWDYLDFIAERVLRRLDESTQQPPALDLVNAYENYIQVLTDEIDDLIGSAAVHGFKSRNVKRGEEARERIEKAKAEQPPVDAARFDDTVEQRKIKAIRAITDSKDLPGFIAALQSQLKPIHP